MLDNFLLTVPLFKDLEGKEVLEVEKVLTLHKYPKNSMIVVEEEFGDVVYIIVSGTIKITRLNDDGKEVILSLLGSGEFFGEMAVIDGEARSANAITQEKCEVYAINSNEFLNLLKNNHKISFALLNELAKRIRRSDQQIKALSLSDAEHRIGVSILNIAEEMGIIRRGQVTIKNLLHQQDIANMAGTSRETVSRVFKLLEDRHILIKESGHTMVIPDYKYFKQIFG